MANITSIALLSVAFLMIMIGFYGLLRTRSIFRLMLAAEVAMKAIALLLAIAGIMNGNLALAQTFIITMLVVEVVLVVVAAGIAVSVYRQTGNLDISNLNKLKG